MVWLNFNGGQSASFFMLLIIGEVLQYAISAPSRYPAVKYATIDPSLAASELNFGMKNGSSAALDQETAQEMMEIENPFSQLEKALNLNTFERKCLKQDIKTFIQQLVQSYRNYSNSTGTSNFSRSSIFCLNQTNIREYNGTSEIKVAEEHNLVFVRRTLDDSGVGFFKNLHGYDRGTQRREDSQLLLQYHSFRFDNGLIYFMRDEDKEEGYQIDTSFSYLMGIMKIVDPFKKLAKMVDRRPLKIEFILEDQLNRAYIIFFNDFTRASTTENITIDFSIDHKKMSAYMFNFYDEGELALPIIIENDTYLKWNPETNTYVLEEEPSLVVAQSEAA